MRCTGSPWLAILAQTIEPALPGWMSSPQVRGLPEDSADDVEQLDQVALGARLPDDHALGRA